MNLACQGKENKKEGESISDTYVKNAEMKSYKTIFTFPSKAGKGSCGVDTSFPLSPVSYWFKHIQYFALIHLNVKLQCYA